MSYLGSEYISVNPLKSESVDMGIKVQQMKQGQYDAAKSLIDQTLAQYNEKLKGIRDEDNQYIAEKLKNVKSQIDIYSKTNGDLSKSYNRDSIMSAITSTLQDPIVQDAIVSRNNDMALNAQIEKAREKDPKLVTQENINFSRHIGGRDAYMRGETKKLGVMNYDLYTDFNKELQDVANNLDKYDTEVKKVWVDGTGYKFTREGKFIDESKLKNIAQNFLSNGAKKQMVINGFASIYTGNNEEEKQANTKLAYNQFKQKSLFSQKNILINAEATARKTGLPADKQNVEIAQRNYTDLETNLNKIGESGSQAMYGTIYTENTLNNFAKNFSYNTVDITGIDNDVTYKNRVDEQWRRERAAVDDSQSDRTYNLAVRSQDLAEAKAFPSRKEGAIGTKSTISPVANAMDVEVMASKEITDLGTSIDKIINPAYNKLSDKIKAEIDQQVLNSKGIKTKADVMMEYNHSNENIISVSDADALNNLMGDKLSKQQDYNQKRDTIVKQAESNLDSPAFFKEVFDRPGVKIMWRGSDGKERMYPLRDVLLNNKMVDKNGNKTDVSNSIVSNAIKKSVLADKTLSSTQVYDYSTNLKLLATTMGEDMNTILTKGKTEYNSGFSMGQYQGSQFTQETLDPNSKTAQFLKKHKDNKAYNIKNRFQNDDSFDDIDALSPYFNSLNPQKIKEEVGKLIAADKKVTFGKTVTIMPDTEEYKLVARQAGFKIDDKTPIFITKIQGNSELVNVTLGQGSSIKLKATTQGVNSELRIDELPDLVRKQANFYDKKPIYTASNFPQMRQTATYSAKEGTQITELAEGMYGGTNDNAYNQASLTTKAVAKKYFFNYPNMGTETKPTELGRAVLNLLNANDNIVETQKSVVGGRTYIIPQLKRGNNLLFSPKATEKNLITDENADASQRRIKLLPQEYFNTYLNKMLSTQLPSDVENFIKIYNK